MRGQVMMQKLCGWALAHPGPTPSNAADRVGAGAKAVAELVQKVVAAGLRQGDEGTKPHLERYCGWVQVSACLLAVVPTSGPARAVGRAVFSLWSWRCIGGAGKILRRGDGRRRAGTSAALQEAQWNDRSAHPRPEVQTRLRETVDTKNTENKKGRRGWWWWCWWWWWWWWGLISQCL